MSGSQSQSGNKPKDAPAFLFDFDGTPIDSIYRHVVACYEAPLDAAIELSAWRIHRRIRMSGGLLVNALARETDRHLNEGDPADLLWHLDELGVRRDGWIDAE